MDDSYQMPPRRGRAASSNPANRFEKQTHIEDPAALDADELRQIPTEYLTDTSKTALAKNTSPDVPFTFSLNPYRGCEHGCIYCYARPSHEYLGFSAGLDFETKIVVKHDAPELLAQTFDGRSWVPQVVALSGNTDPYQPVERRLKLTRRCLEVFLEYRNPISLITKNQLVTRDIDLLKELAALNLLHVTVSITSLRPELIRVMEPRTSQPAARLATVRALSENGIPVGVNIAPVIPGLTDDEMPAILEAAAEAGASSAGYLVMRLPGTVRPIFVDWLRREFPDRENKVIGRLKDLFGNELRDTRWHVRMRGEGQWAVVFRQLFHNTRNRLGLRVAAPDLDSSLFRRPGPRNQLTLFA